MASFCNPTDLDDFFKPRPEDTLVVTPPAAAPVPRAPGPLADPNAPGNLDALGLPTGYRVTPAGLDPLGNPTYYKPSPAGGYESQADKDLAVQVATATAVVKTNQQLEDSLSLLDKLELRLGQLEQLGHDLGSLQNVWRDTGDLKAILADMRGLLAGTVFHDTQALEDFDRWNAEHVTPVLDWAAQVNALVSQDFDLDPNGSSFDTLIGVAQAIDVIPGPWKGQGKNLATWAHGMVDSYKNILAVSDEAGRVLEAADRLATAASTALLAACQALPALDMMLRDALEKLTHLDLMGLLGGLFSLPIKLDFRFKFPRIPAFDTLGKWAGLALNLDKVLGNFLAQCLGPWTARHPSSQIPYMVPNPNAFKDGLAAIRSAQTAQADLGKGIGKLEELVPHSLDPYDVAMRQLSSAVDIAPNPSHCTPDDAAALGATVGATVPTAVDPQVFQPGASSVTAGRLAGAGVDPETGDPSDIPAAPTPAQQLDNQHAVCQELAGTLKCAQELATIMSEVSAYMRTLGPTASEADAAVALDHVLKAVAATAVLQNLAVDPDLDPASLARVARDYYACLREQELAGERAPSTDAAAIKTKLESVTEASPGLPHSVLSTGQANNPAVVVTPGAVNLPTSVMPPSFYSTEQRTLVESYKDPQTPGDRLDLPLLLLCQTADEWDRYLAFKSLMGILAAIQADPVMLAAHATLKGKALSQGLLAHSPYTWYATVLEALAGRDPLPLMREFLRHGDVDVRSWGHALAGLPETDAEVPLPSGLTEAEAAAAQASYAYTLVHRDDPGSLLVQWRLRADAAGQALGFEFVVAVAILMLVERARVLLQGDDPDEEVLVAILADAHTLTEHMTHPQGLAAVLAAVVEG